jgi:hypothetical protein
MLARGAASNASATPGVRQKMPQAPEGRQNRKRLCRPSGASSIFRVGFPGLRLAFGRRFTRANIGRRSAAERRRAPEQSNRHLPAFAAAYFASTAFQFTTFHHASM